MLVSVSRMNFSFLFFFLFLLFIEGMIRRLEKREILILAIRRRGDRRRVLLLKWTILFD